MPAPGPTSGLQHMAGYALIVSTDQNSPYILLLVSLLHDSPPQTVIYIPVLSIRRHMQGILGKCQKGRRHFVFIRNLINLAPGGKGQVVFLSPAMGQTLSSIGIWISVYHGDDALS